MQYFVHTLGVVIVIVFVIACYYYSDDHNHSRSRGNDAVLCAHMVDHLYHHYHYLVDKDHDYHLGDLNHHCHGSRT